MYPQWPCRLEARTGSLFLGLGWAMALLAGAILYVGVGTVPVLHGTELAELSTDPFDLSRPNRFRFRILAPLLGWLTGLRGDRFVFVPWIFLLLLLAVAFAWCRREGLSLVGAALLTACLAFSCVVFIPLAAPGYTDPVTFTFVLLALFAVRRPVLAALAMALAIGNHELAVFSVPALLWYGTQREGRVWLGWFLPALAVCLLPYIAFRWWVAQHDAVALSSDFYFSRRNVADSLYYLGPLTVKGMAAAFRLAWLLPIAACVLHVRGRRIPHAVFHGLVLGGALAALLIAYDTTRLACTAFPMLLVAGVELAQAFGERVLVRVLMGLFALNFLLDPIMVSGKTVFGVRDAIRQGEPRSARPSSVAAYDAATATGTDRCP